MTTVKDILQQKGYTVWTIDKDETVYKALEIMAEKDIGALPVMDGDKIVGLFSEREYARKVILRGKTSKASLVKEMMLTEIVFITQDKSISEAMTLMNEMRRRYLPVFDNSKMIGIITIGDVVNMIIKDQHSKIKDLENYIMGSAFT